ncbi:type II toxin-antitoxin system VapC family toxin [Mycobacteroides immunogenum]|uniref:type II toxin-antitoxin system VapC family toxin n=1 Tax=Mycobacteroides immunogenum TaxID=83262 RepID=UPI0025B79ECA|nr:type II toxin-antitoxin system VapC family toxin [Mycobacteroides immunogenum]WJR35273.1 type II toxin-antitoxin system VapC family toxin [Mycobacteroides immunogenum]
MTDRLPRVAVDTCVVLDLLVPIDAKRAERAEYLLAGHGSRHQVILPAIVIAEIAGSGRVRGDDGGGQARKERIVKAAEWIRGCKFGIAELSARTARIASDLATEHNLKGADATVLATAQEWDCTRLYTRDTDLLKCEGSVGFKVTEPEDLPPPVPDLFNTADTPA